MILMKGDMIIMGDVTEQFYLSIMDLSNDVKVTLAC